MNIKINLGSNYMFDVGKTYEITLQDCWDDHGAPGTSAFIARILDVEMPLIKYQQSGLPPVILNTSSATFVSAVEYKGAA